MILGRGIAGCCAYQAACELGLNAEIVGDHPEASSAALAVLSGPFAAMAAHWYRERGYPVKLGALYSTYRKPQARMAPSQYCVDPAPILELGRRAAGSQLALELDGNIGGNDFTADVAIPTLDCRARDDGGRVSYGATWYHRDPAALASPELRIHVLRPYHEVHAVAWSSGARIGSSTGASPAAARKDAQAMMEYAIRARWVDRADGWSLLEGRRVRQAWPVKRLGNGCVRFGGFHRSGYTIAPMLARVAIEEVTASAALRGV